MTIKSLIGILFPVFIFILASLGLVWLSDFITPLGSIILGGITLGLARYL